MSLAHELFKGYNLEHKYCRSNRTSQKQLDAVFVSELCAGVLCSGGVTAMPVSSRGLNIDHQRYCRHMQ